MRKEEQRSDTFAVFCRKLLRVAKRYPGAGALIPSMQKRVQEVLRRKGGMTKCWRTDNPTHEHERSFCPFRIFKMEFMLSRAGT